VTGPLSVPGKRKERFVVHPKEKSFPFFGVRGNLVSARKIKFSGGWIFKSNFVEFASFDVQDFSSQEKSCFEPPAFGLPTKLVLLATNAGFDMGPTRTPSFSTPL